MKIKIDNEVKITEVSGDKQQAAGDDDNDQVGRSS